MDLYFCQQIFIPDLGDSSMTVRIPGYHAMGASKEVTDGTERACLAACEDNPECMAVDFNMKEGSCWVHMRGGQGVCGTLIDSPPVTHFERYQCGEYIQLWKSQI